MDVPVVRRVEMEVLFLVGWEGRDRKSGIWKEGGVTRSRKSEAEVASARIVWT